VTGARGPAAAGEAASGAVRPARAAMRHDWRASSAAKARLEGSSGVTSSAADGERWRRKGSTTTTAVARVLLLRGLNGLSSRLRPAAHEKSEKG
jgi:hypothetical protein